MKNFPSMNTTGNTDATRILPSESDMCGILWALRSLKDPQVWPLAFSAILRATGEAPEAVRHFLQLDSMGGMFGALVMDEIKEGATLAEGIAIVVERWMTKQSYRALGRYHYTCKRHVPYLVGMVIDAGLEYEMVMEIKAEIEAAQRATQGRQPGAGKRH